MIELTVWQPELEIYNPGLSVEAWKKLLQNEKIFSAVDLEIMRRFQNHEFSGTLAQIVYAFGENYFFYKNNLEKLGKKIVAETNCPVYQNNYENVLLLERKVGKYAKKYEDENGNRDMKFYKIRDELAAALAEIDLSGVKLFTAEKMAEKLDFNYSNSKNKNSVQYLETVFMDADKSADGKRKIPIKGYFSRPTYDDCRIYYIINGNGKIRLAEDVAIKLLANGLAYQVYTEDFVGIESLWGKKYTPITPAEYENLKLQLGFKK